jgi:putative endonuclease
VKHFAYILRSQKDGIYYYGSTEDLERRLYEHNPGKVHYTKGHMPYVLYYSEGFGSRSEAVRREQFFKSIDGYKWPHATKIIV